LRSLGKWIINDNKDNGFTESQVYFWDVDKKYKTGPQTGNNNKSNYIYLSSLSRTSPNTNAILKSPKIEIDRITQGCLKFLYQMYQGEGEDEAYALRIGNLSVVTKLQNGSKQLNWLKEGNQGVEWQRAEVDLLIYPPSSVISFESVLYNWNYGDICIDDISFKKGSCNGNIPFELKTKQNINIFLCFRSN
jgi:hypothetical protein